MILNLSDAFPKEKREESDIQVRVRMININPGKNNEFAKKCKPLEEYIWTVESIREGRAQKMTIEDSIDKTLDEMPDEFEIKPFLMANRVGVKKMLLTEYNERETMELFREEGREEGREEERRKWEQKDREWQQKYQEMQKTIESMRLQLKEASGWKEQQSGNL